MDTSNLDISEEERRELTAFEQFVQEVTGEKPQPEN
jgi:hypothetical protein